MNWRWGPIKFQRRYGEDGVHATPYMTLLTIGRLRFHVFHRGDEDPDPHDHPWDFWTFPLTSYFEEVHEETAEGWRIRHNLVRSFRPHYRPAEYLQRVVCRAAPGSGPIFTLVWRSGKERPWGFRRWTDHCWIPWRKYVFEGGKTAPCDDGD